MELYLILKIIFIVGVLVAVYAILRNLDIIKKYLFILKINYLESKLINFFNPFFFKFFFDIKIHA